MNNDDDNIIKFKRSRPDGRTYNDLAREYVSSNPDDAGDFAIALMGEVVARAHNRVDNEEYTFDQILTSFLRCARRRARERRREIEGQ
jgi:hypothetical protein